MLRAGNAQLQAIDQAVQDVCRIELTGDQLVAYGCPTGFLLGCSVRPYFLSKPFTEAMTTGAQSVSGINPTRTVAFSGASEPAAHTALRNPGNSHSPPTAALDNSS